MLKATQTTRIGTILAALACAVSLSACEKGGGGAGTPAEQWLQAPTNGVKKGDALSFSALGVEFERPDTLYVFRNCDEAPHSPNENQWIPVVTCSSGGGGADLDEDGFETDEYDSDAAEEISLTFYVTSKARPLDERAVTWFKSQYVQAGLDVDDISYQGEYQKKSGIYAKLHTLDGDTGAPTREVVQFMFPKNDVVFIAKMEYPFGESRSVDADWKYLLWNFNVK